jgi:4-methylaminobutanoate oxidase (formaldehyde-forming)
MTPEQALERWPVMQVEDLLGAIWLPGDGKANPTDLTMALAKGARMRGARVVERTRVLDVLTRDGAVSGVRTDRGDIEAEVVVNCAGQWAAQVGAMAGVPVPLHSAEHFYVVTDQVDGVHSDLPILRDPDGWTYFKEEVGGLVVGGFEPEAKPWVSPHQVPYPFEFALLEEDWEHFSVLMDSALHRIPALEETGIRKFYNGPESFTPDNQFLMGEAPGLRGFFVGAGFNSVGIASAGGAGRARRGRADQRPGRRGHPSLRAVRRQPALAAGPGRGDPGPALRGALAEPRARQRPAAAVLPALRPAARAQRRLRLEDGLGARQLLRAVR